MISDAKLFQMREQYLGPYRPPALHAKKVILELIAEIERLRLKEKQQHTSVRTLTK